MIKSIRISSPAKINLGLKIPFKYENGYHHIVSLFAPIPFYDHLEIDFLQEERYELTWESTLDEKFKSGMQSAFDQPEKNLLIKTWTWFKKWVRENDPGFWREYIRNFPGISIHIIKSIPSPSGLGGGSSNAASLLRAIYATFPENKFYKDENYQLKFNTDVLKLGADIPFFLGDSPALISGIGEIFSRHPGIAVHGILGIPPFGFATSQMYSNLKKALQSAHDKKNSLSIIHRDFADLIEYMTNGMTLQKWEDSLLLQNRGEYIWLENEFWDAGRSLFPEMSEILQTAIWTMADCLAREQIIPLISMSGSGSSIFCVVPNTEDAQTTIRIQKKLKILIPDFMWISY